MTSQFDLTKVNVKFEDLKKFDETFFTVKKILSYLIESEFKHENLFEQASAMAEKIRESFVKLRKGEISDLLNICNILKLYKENFDAVENDFALIEHLRGQFESIHHRAEETDIYGICKAFLNDHENSKKSFESMQKSENNYDDAEKFKHKILKGEYDDDVEMYQFEGVSAKGMLIKIASIQLLRVLILMEEKTCEKGEYQLLNATLIGVYQFFNSDLLENNNENLTFKEITELWKLRKTSHAKNEMKQFMEIEFLSKTLIFGDFEFKLDQVFGSEPEQYEIILFNKWKTDCVVKMHQKFNSDFIELAWVKLLPKAKTFESVENILKTGSEVYKLLQESCSPTLEKSQVSEIRDEFDNIRKSVEDEMRFCKDLRNFLLLSYSVYPELLDQIKTREFALKQLSAKELIERVKKIELKVGMDEDLTGATTLLKHTSAGQNDSGVYYVIGSMRNELKNLHNDIEIINKDENGEKKILTVCKYLLVLSQERKKIEKKLKDVKQVVFVTDFFDINDNLEREQWHGKNIEIIANQIYVRGEIIWNLSGNDGKAAPADDAGQDNLTGIGLDGEHGYAGESGGILKIDVAKVAVKSESWKIISNGGQGGDAQNGGAGIAGVNGLDCTVDDVKADDSGFFSTNSWLQRKSTQHFEDRGKQIHRITNHDWFRVEQMSFCIGTDGVNGERGGAGGRSGEGGFSGYVTKNKEIMMKVSRERGSDGQEGKPGPAGANGKTGRDMGMIKQFGGAGELIGDKEELKLERKEYESKQEHSMHSHYHNKFIGFNVIGSLKEAEAASVAEAKKTTMERKSHAIAKKNVLSRSSISLKSKLGKKLDYQKMFETLREASVESEASIVESEKIEKDAHRILRSKRSISDFEKLLIACQSETSSEMIFKALQKMELNRWQCLELQKVIMNSKITKVGVERFLNRDTTSTFLDPIIEDYFKLTNISKPAGKTFLQVLRKRSIFKSFVSFLKQNCSPCGVDIFRKFFKIAYEGKDVEKLLIEKYKQASLNTLQLGKISKNLKIDINEIPTRLLIPNTNFDSEVRSETFGNLSNYFGKNNELSETLLKLDKEHFVIFIPSILKHLKQNLNLYPEMANVEENVETTSDVIRQFINTIDLTDIKASEAFRNALAESFAINLKAYEIDFDGTIQLKRNYNQVNDLKVVHVLKTCDKYVTMHVAKDKYLFMHNIKKSAIICDTLLNKINALVTIQEVDEYLSNISKNVTVGVAENRFKKLKKFGFTKALACEKLLEYSPDANIEDTLTYLSLQLNDETTLLQTIMSRLFNDGFHLPQLEFQRILEVTLIAILKNENCATIFEMTFMSSSQKEWSAKLCWNVMEQYFIDASKSEIIELQDQLKVSKRNLNIITLARKIVELQNEQLKPEVVIDILKTFKEFEVDSIPSLIDTKLAMWKSSIIEVFWTSKFISLQNKNVINEEDSGMASLYLSTFKTTFGYELVKELVELFEERHQELQGVDIRAILLNFYNSEWLLTEQTMKILKEKPAAAWIQELNKYFASDGQTRGLADIKRYVVGDTKTSKNCRDMMTLIEQEFEKLKVMKCEKINDKKFSEFTIGDVEEWLKNVFKAKLTSKLESLAVIIRVIELVTATTKKQSINLRDVQIFAILQLLHSEKGISAQISTGEGKSFIAAAFAILKALYGEHVDVITSSSVLAVRDAKDETIRGLFEAFKVSFGNNCAGNVSERKEVYNKHSVIYGTLSNFQRDYLLDKFFDLEVMTNHRLQNVIIDEADSMLLDKGSNILYLSKELPDMDSLTSLFIFIWSLINQPVMSTKEREQNLNKELISEIVINEMFTMISQHDIKSFDSELSKDQIKDIWNKLISSKVVSSIGKILMSDVTEDKLSKILSEKYSKDISSKLVYLIDKTLRRYRQFSIPAYLERFVLMHLNDFIGSALKALDMQIDSEYIVDKPDRKSTDDIVILDIDTGTEQINSQWDRGLHQFLQLKHGCKVSSLSLKSVFISNVSYIKLYKDSIYGISGTLGSEFERNKLLKLYEIDFITIPTYQAKSFVEMKPIIASTSEDWIDQICKEAVKVCKTRSVLIICQTIFNVHVIRRRLINLVRNISAFKRSQDILQFKSTVLVGKVIISTNLAGRGMDLKLDKKLKEAGGLHVILSYLPTNIRVEQQAFGRAARGGARGSARLIVQIAGRSNISDAKRDRDDKEHKRLEELTKYYENFIRVEEKLFDKFNEAYKEMKGDDRKMKIQKENFLFNWSFWLDENNKLLNVDDNKDYDELIRKLDEFIVLHKNFDPELLTTHPTCQIKLLKYFLSQNEFESSEKLFKKLKDEQRCNMDVLSYYTFFVMVKHLQKQQSCMPKDIPKDYYNQLKASLRKFEARKEQRQYSQAMLAAANRNNEMRGFDGHNKILEKIDNIFITSIHSLLGVPVTSDLFYDKFIGSSETCNQLYEILLQLKVINYPKIAESCDYLQCKEICEQYFIAWAHLNEFLSERKNKDIDVDEFIRSLETEFPLPNREGFWKLLVDKDALIDEVYYAIVEKNSMQIFDAEFLKTLQQYIDNKRIELKSLPKASAKTVFFNTWSEKNVMNDSKDQNKNTVMIFNLNELKAIMESDLEPYIKEQCIRINKSANVNLIKGATCILNNFDSITIDDLKVLQLNDETATEILTSLIEQKVITKSPANPMEYSLLEVEDSVMLLKYQNYRSFNLGKNDVYKDDVELLIEHKFAYRIALNGMMADTTKSRVVSIQSKPYLFSDMIKSSIVQYGKVEKDNIKKINAYRADNFNESRLIEFFTKHGLDLDFGIFRKILKMENWK